MSRTRGWSLAALGLVVVLAVGLGCYRLYLAPATEQVSRDHPVDVILALGGDPKVASLAYALAVGGASTQVLLSNPYGAPHPANVVRLCHLPAGGPVSVTCFVPDPSTTRGEAQELARMVALHGWRRVAVVADRFHVSRARYIVRRCFTGPLALVAEPAHYSLVLWLHQFAYQSGAFVKAMVFEHGC